MLATAALTRTDVANYVGALFEVYIALIFIYLLTTIALSLGARPPYSRALNAVLTFLREVSEPYLRLFRRIIPQMGMLDLSPMLAIMLLIVLEIVIVGAIRG